MIEADGASGSIHFDGRFVALRPKRGLMGAMSGRSEVRFALNQISQIEWSAPTAMKSGYIRICTGGMMPLRGTLTRPAFMDAGQDANSMVFSKRHLSGVSDVRDAIEEAMAG